MPVAARIVDAVARRLVDRRAGRLGVEACRDDDPDVAAVAERPGDERRERRPDPDVAAATGARRPAGRSRSGTWCDWWKKRSLAKRTSRIRKPGWASPSSRASSCPPRRRTAVASAWRASERHRRSRRRDRPVWRLLDPVRLVVRGGDVDRDVDDALRRARGRMSMSTRATVRRRRRGPATRREGRGTRRATSATTETARSSACRDPAAEVTVGRVRSVAPGAPPAHRPTGPQAADPADEQPDHHERDERGCEAGHQPAPADVGGRRPRPGGPRSLATTEPRRSPDRECRCGAGEGGIRRRQPQADLRDGPGVGWPRVAAPAVGVDRRELRVGLGRRGGEPARHPRRPPAAPVEGVELRAGRCAPITVSRSSSALSAQSSSAFAWSNCQARIESRTTARQEPRPRRA